MTFRTTFRDTRSSRQIALIDLPCPKNARRIFAIVSTISIPTSAPIIMEASVTPGVPIGCRSPRKRGPYSTPKHNLAVVLDWFSRRVLSWRLSITMEAAFCVETLEDALARHGKPEIFNTDQGSQFTGTAFTGLLANHGIAISMDGKGAWRDNVFVERLWRSVKYEEVYLRAYETVGEARSSI